MTEIGDKVYNRLFTIINSHLHFGQSIQVETPSIQAYYVKNNVSMLSNELSVQNCKITIPSFCSLLNSECDVNKTITQNVKS